MKTLDSIILVLIFLFIGLILGYNLHKEPVVNLEIYTPMDILYIDLDKLTVTSETTTDTLVFSNNQSIINYIFDRTANDITKYKILTDNNN